MTPWFWQSYAPSAIIGNIGSWSVHWYGLILVLAILTAYFYVRPYFIKQSVLSRAQVDDLFFYIVIAGLLGSRLGHVLFYNLPYYLQYPQDIVKVWQGGLSIHGAVFFAFLTLWLWAKYHRVSFWQIADHLVPALALGQAIGRWGNYFNQELYGRPTDAWWGIYIAPGHRVAAYEYYDLFTPAFLWESVLNIILFIVLHRLLQTKKWLPGIITIVYLLGYGIIRFFMEFIRIDPTPSIWIWRLPQLISLFMLITAGLVIFHLQKKSGKSFRA